MSAEAAALTATWAVGRYTVTLTVPKVRPGQTAAAAVEWSPHMPIRLTVAELEQYLAGRDRAIAGLGLRVLVIDLG